MNKVNQQGFTLIECLVALFIAALVLTAVSRNVKSIIQNVRASYLSQIASYVAANQLCNMYLSVDPRKDNQTITTSMAGFNFQVVSKVTSTPIPGFLKVVIQVSELKNKGRLIANTTSYISNV